MMSRAAVSKSSFVKKTLRCLLAAVLILGLAPAIQPQKAYAAQTITEVELIVDFDAIPLNAATTGRQANSAFRDNSGLSEDTKTICTMDKAYSFLVRKTGMLSSGKIGRERLGGSDALLTKTWTGTNGQTESQYYLVFNLIQKKDYEFPSGDVLTSQMTVKVNGETLPGVQVNSYNSDSVDVYVPIAFDDALIVDDVTIDPNSISIKRGTSRQLEATITGSQEASLRWYIQPASGTTLKSGTTVDSATGLLTVDASEPEGTQFTVFAAYEGANNTVMGSCKVYVLEQDPFINRVVVTPGNVTVDVSDGVSKTTDFSVYIEGTADHDYTVELQNAKNKSTQVTNISKDGFSLNVAAYEPTGTLRILVRSAQDSTKSNLVTVSVMGVSRVDRIDMVVDFGELYFDATSAEGPKTVQDIYNAFTYSNVGTSGLSTSIDPSYCRLVVRKDGTEGFDRENFDTLMAKDHGTEPLVEGAAYYLALNVENTQYGSGASLWPDDIESVTTTINSASLDEWGAGVNWYSRSENGSVNVYVPLPTEAKDKLYTVDEYAKGIYLVTATGYSAPHKGMGKFWDILQYKGETMYYDYAEGVWYYLVASTTEPVLSLEDFTTKDVSSGSAYLFYPYEINGIDTEVWQQVGDVNGSGRINIVDAQIVYDAATGVYDGIDDLKTTNLAGMKAWLYADANGDRYIDAADARAIQCMAVS